MRQGQRHDSGLHLVAMLIERFCELIDISLLDAISVR
jgi:hypothetical protein